MPPACGPLVVRASATIAAIPDRGYRPVELDAGIWEILDSMGKASGLIAGLVALLLLGCGAAAAIVEDLYQAQAIVTGQTEQNRGAGFAQCLTDVLVKVSGDPRLIDDARVAAMAGQAGTFVRAFRYRDRMEGIPVHDEQGTRDRPYDLTCDFHPEKIDAALRSLGREPWTASRPRLVVFLAVRNGPVTYVLTDDGKRGPGQREALLTASRKMGVPMTLPTQTALAGAGLSFENMPAADLQSLDATAKTAGGDLALAGSMVFSDEVHGWIADWRLGWLGKTYRWRIQGVNFDEAFRSAMRGAAHILSGHGQPA